MSRRLPKRVPQQQLHHHHHHHHHHQRRRLLARSSYFLLQSSAAIVLSLNLTSLQNQKPPQLPSRFDFFREEVRTKRSNMGPGRHARMLLQTYQSMGNPDDAGEPLNSISPSPTSLTSAPTSKETAVQNPPFDTSMGLTILVLLTALFFMGFFSIYFRRFSQESPVDLSRRRRFRGSTSYDNRNTSLSPSASRYCSRKGLDPYTIESLPVLRYGSGFGKRYPVVVVDCPICLGEFGEGESVKVIPSCRHFFHPGCINTWLVARATCPVCRTTKLLSVEFDEKVVASREPDVETGTVVEAEENVADAMVVEDGIGMRRSCSCSSLSGRGGLQRTRSF